ncbi:hypothetical protein DUNSADRAFT_10828 [Dunaliella salina]|uniref:Encoded protein n=1 Tax=Dunaliella salina TaxID=3046 RepID=A0ABQ7H9X3_DUNSA|nr:hypothetical protein DUNSADRAFT_10828 [Dunaliella salina]|eukprot:KAF5843653.1 hypothetical protein DUNSADRAFT_10828 [Dunaliella salina]
MLAPAVGWVLRDHSNSRSKGFQPYILFRAHAGHSHQPHPVHLLEKERTEGECLGAARPNHPHRHRNTARIGRPATACAARFRHLAPTKQLHVSRRL